VAQLQKSVEARSIQKSDDEKAKARQKAIADMELAQARNVRGGRPLAPSRSKEYAADTGMRIATQTESQTTRMHQDLEYEASLTADQLKEERRRLLEERKALAKRREADRVSDEERARLALAEKKETLRTRLPVEPIVSSAIDEGVESVLRLTVRLPSGTRAARLFLAESPLQALFDFIDLQDEMLPDGVYELVAQYPRRTWSRPSLTASNLLPSAPTLSEAPVNLEQAGLRHGDTVYVQEPLQVKD